MLRVTGGMRGQYLLAAQVLFLTSIPFAASAEFKCRSMIGLEARPLRHVRHNNMKATRIRQEPFKYCSPGGTELPLVERGWQLCGTMNIRLLEAFTEKYTADPVYARVAEARIEEPNRQRAVPLSHRIPTIQLLDCTALTEEEVCKGLMCMWEAGRCHEATSTAAPEVIGPTVQPPQ